MFTAQADENGPFSIRYPRGKGITPDWKKPFQKLTIGQGRKLKNGTDIAILTIGITGTFIAKIEDDFTEKGLSVAHYDMRFLKPLDETILHEVFSKFDKVITVEDGTIIGGLGSAVLEFMADNGYQAQVKRLGIPDKYIEHGTQAELYKECGFDANSILECVEEMLQKTAVVKTIGK
jgi:1-deoxy-D-xylulose-5-phosphate synthase